MKYFVTFWLLVVTLFIGVTTITVSKNEIAETKHHITGIRQSSSQHQQPTSFNSSNLSLGAGMRNSKIRNTNSFQRLSFRTLRAASRIYGIKHSTKLVHQKYIANNTQFSFKSALNLINGYYLHHLCKLLI